MFLLPMKSNTRLTIPHTQGAITPPSSSFSRPIARLGCGVHQRLPGFRTLTHSPLHRSITASLNYHHPLITQSQLIAKPSHHGGRIIPHQDGCISYTNPPSGLTFWYALQDSTLNNGCLFVAAGSHLTEPLRQRVVKANHDNNTGPPQLKDLPNPVWAREAGVAADRTTTTPKLDKTRTDTSKKEYDYRPLEVKKGTLILFHGNVLHKSGANTSENGRMAFTFSVIEGDCECPDDSYIKPIGGNFLPL